MGNDNARHSGSCFPADAQRNGHGRQPGSAGERILQERYGTQAAQQFYDSQVTSRLTPVMQQFIQRMQMAFIATSDASGECDCSFRAGPAGFIRVLDDHTIAYPEYRGNGVMASLGNMLQNPHIGIFLLTSARSHRPARQRRRQHRHARAHGRA